MTLTDFKDIAVIIGIIIATLTYITNSYFQFRNKNIENLKRYFDAHDALFEKESFLSENLLALEKDTYTRDKTNDDMELKFNRLQKTHQIGHQCRFSSDTCVVSNRTVMSEIIRTLLDKKRHVRII